MAVSDWPDPLPSIRQAAAYAGVAADTVRYWIETGRVAAESFPIGQNRREYRIRRADLDPLIATRRERDEQAQAVTERLASAAAALTEGQLPRDLVEAVAFHDRLLTRWRRSESSHNQYRHFLAGQYLRFLSERHIDLGLQSLTPQLVGQCQDWMRAQQMRGKHGGAVSEATFVRCIKAFARALTEQGVYAYNPLERQKSVRAPKAERTPYTESELRRFLEAADDGTDPLRDRALVLLLLDLGCRIGELCKADVGDVDLERGSIKFHRTKNGQPREVGFGVPGTGGGPCLSAVRAWLRARSTRKSDPLFTGEDGERLTSRGAERIIARLGRNAGVSNPIPHRFRHTNATQFLSQRPGAEIQLRARLGHLSDSVLADYVHITQAMAEDGARVASISSRLLGEGGDARLPSYASTHTPASTEDLVERVVGRLKATLAEALARQESRWASLDERLTQLQDVLAAIVATVADGSSRFVSSGAHRSSAHADLSERETQVLQLLAYGLRAVAIAEQLAVTVRTVNHHIDAICAKLHVANRVQAVTLGVELGLVNARALSAPTPAMELPRRQREVLELLPSQLTQPEIAERLGVAPSTVKHHFDVLYAKLGARDRHGAIRRAAELGLVQNSPTVHRASPKALNS